MWEKLFGYIRHQLTLVEATQRNTEAIREIRSELKELTAELQQLKDDLRRATENDRHERKKLVLLIENKLLRFERALRPPRDSGSERK